MIQNVDVVVVEDEEDLLNLLLGHLAAVDIHATGFTRGEKFLEIYNELNPKILVVDRMLPGINGLSIVQEVRKMDTKVKIMFFTALESTEDIIEGLSAGADDYFKKMTPLPEMVARISFALSCLSNSSPLELLQVNPTARELKLAELTIPLTEREFEIFDILNRSRGIVATHEQILGKMCQTAHITPNNIPVHIRSLRNKLEPLGLRIHTVHGVGYRLEQQVESNAA